MIFLAVETDHMETHFNMRRVSINIIGRLNSQLLTSLIFPFLILTCFCKLTREDLHYYYVNGYGYNITRYSVFPENQSLSYLCNVGLVERCTLKQPFP